MFTSINPYTLKDIKSYSFITNRELEYCLGNSKKAFKLWGKETLKSRCLQIEKVGKLLTSRLEEGAELISLEMGKPISQSILEIEKCIDLCNFYSQKAEKYLQPKIGETTFESYITYEPLGAILGIMPWNFPFWQVFRFVIPTLIAGNTVIVKHALNVPACAEFIEKLFQNSISEVGVYQNVFLNNQDTQNLISHPIIKGVSFTGSTKVGRIIASEAGKNLKPSILELGGSNAMIVFKDADINKAVAACIKGRFLNNGQSCIAVKRLLIDKSVQEEFVTKLVNNVKEFKIGAPEEKSTFISVLSKPEFAEELYQKLSKSVKMGAKVVYGGNTDDSFFEPTIVNNVTSKMPIFTEETFGPVLAISTFSTVDEAIDLANSTDYGLGVSLFSEDKVFIDSIISRFEDGAVFVNSFVASIAELPFGGTKNSGLGRELAEEGIKAFVNTKTVVIK